MLVIIFLTVLIHTRPALQLNKNASDALDETEFRQTNCGSSTPVFVSQGFQGRFSSPNYPNSYPGGSSCMWILNTSSNSKFSLICDLQTISCPDDYLIYSPSGDIQFSDASSAVCGNGRFQVNSTGSSLAIYFQSAYFTYGGAFTCIAQAVPAIVTPPPTPVPQCDCGIKGQNRVVGGEPSGLTEWPWQAVLADISLEGGGRQYCGATLLAPSWIITASHCTFGRNAANLAVVVGQYDTVTLSATSQVRKVVKIIEHPQFNRTRVDNDIALLQLESPVQYTASVRPICLPTRFTKYNFDSQIGIVTGWGTTSFGGPTSDTLQEVPLNIMSTAKCAQNPAIGSRITENMFCTYTDGKDACQGDSGGPLNWVDPTTGRVYLIGVTSWGVGCARKDVPGVYTKLTNYVSWIQQFTGTLCSV